VTIVFPHGAEVSEITGAAGQSRPSRGSSRGRKREYSGRMQSTPLEGWNRENTGRTGQRLESPFDNRQNAVEKDKKIPKDSEFQRRRHTRAAPAEENCSLRRLRTCDSPSRPLK
jgi:hypothetical protein